MTNIVQLPQLQIRPLDSEQLAEAVSHAAQAGCEDFNLAAKALFEDLGWRQAGAELMRLAPGVRHEAIVYTRSLPLEEAS